jgi:putative hydrolase of the HAD superfamily
MQYFNGAIIFSNEICKKPCKNIFLQALKKDNIIPNNAIMIGDNYKNDIIGAKKIGINTLYLNRNGFGDITNLWDLYYYL